MKASSVIRLWIPLFALLLATPWQVAAQTQEIPLSPFEKLNKAKLSASAKTSCVNLAFKLDRKRHQLSCCPKEILASDYSQRASKRKPAANFYECSFKNTDGATSRDFASLTLLNKRELQGLLRLGEKYYSVAPAKNSKKQKRNTVRVTVKEVKQNSTGEHT